jgi:hypothetical protein
MGCATVAARAPDLWYAAIRDPMAGPLTTHVYAGRRIAGPSFGLQRNELYFAGARKAPGRHVRLSRWGRVNGCGGLVR